MINPSLFHGYTFEQTRHFKDVRVRRQLFYDELIADARDAGLISSNMLVAQRGFGL